MIVPEFVFIGDCYWNLSYNSGTERRYLYFCSGCADLCLIFSGNFRATQMERAVLTFLMMAPNYGQEVWTIQSDPGISEKGDSYSNMTSHHRFSLRTFGMLTKFSHGF